MMKNREFRPLRATAGLIALTPAIVLGWHARSDKAEAQPHTTTQHQSYSGKLCVRSLSDPKPDCSPSSSARVSNATDTEITHHGYNTELAHRASTEGEVAIALVVIAAVTLVTAFPRRPEEDVVPQLPDSQNITQ